MKIGILGTRGIPNRYGGFEQLAQYLSAGLVKNKHEVFVYNPHNHPYKENKWNEVNIIRCNDPEHSLGTAGQFIYDRNCITDSRKRNFDVLLHLGYTSDSIWYKRWPEKTVNIVNMDGLEWKRSKYNFFTKKFLKWSETLAAKHADILISDSPGIQQHILNSYKKTSVYIPYGAEIFSDGNKNILDEYRLLPGRYSLIIARMEPENNVEMIIKGYLASGKKDPLVIIGSPITRFGKMLVKKYKTSQMMFTGSVYDKDKLNNLRFFSSLYFHGHSSGGTNPSLLEAMACGCSVIAHDNVFNRFVLQNNGDFFSSADQLKNIINQSGDPEKVEQRKRRNIERIRSEYNWNKIVNDYEDAMLKALSSR